MTSAQKNGLSSERVHNSSSVKIDHLECPICHQLLWKPVACQTCETPFCSACITRWLASNPNRCPNQCDTYTERKCPPFVAKLLGQLQISCFYQPNGCEEIIPYEALDKHESECDCQMQQCHGCRSNIFKKDFATHEQQCESIEVTCEDCKLAYRRSHATIEHTENICLRRQLRAFKEEFDRYKTEMNTLNSRLDTLTRLNANYAKIAIKFNDLPSAVEQCKAIPSSHYGLKWSGISYGHKSFFEKEYPSSGYVTCYTHDTVPHIIYFRTEGEVSAEQEQQTFTLVSLSAASAWNDGLVLAITGHRQGAEVHTQKARLLFGIPQRLMLQWENIDKVIMKSSGGTAHPGNGGDLGSHVVLTEMTLDYLV